MFSGIITDTVEILRQESVPAGLQLSFARPKQWKDLLLGESIATNGVCLTIDGLDDDSYTTTLIPETLHVTTFGQDVPGRVNLERSLKVGDRISGHFVQGHIDDIGTILSVDESEGYKIWISHPANKGIFIVEKGSITLNGIALTVASVDVGRFCVAVVPHTLASTTLGTAKQGDIVNLEYDVLGKYAVNATQQRNEK